MLTDGSPHLCSGSARGLRRVVFLSHQSTGPEGAALRMVAVLDQVTSSFERPSGVVSISPDLRRKFDGKPRDMTICSGAGRSAASSAAFVSGGFAFARFAGAEDCGHSDA
jgi:hypothetical protein